MIPEVYCEHCKILHPVKKIKEKTMKVQIEIEVKAENHGHAKAIVHNLMYGKGLRTEQEVLEMKNPRQEYPHLAYRIVE